MVTDIREHFGHSEKRACIVLNISRSSYRYEPRSADERVKQRLVELAREKPRYGCRDCTSLSGKRASSSTTRERNGSTGRKVWVYG